MEKEKTGRGGARAGAGRKKTPGRNLTITFKTSLVANERLNAYCAALGIYRNEAITRILETMLIPE